MTSKKVLENIRKRYANSPTFQTWCDIIKQDLDCLEKYKNVIKIINNALELYVADDEIGVEVLLSIMKIMNY